MGVHLVLSLKQVRAAPGSIGTLGASSNPDDPGIGGSRPLCQRGTSISGQACEEFGCLDALGLPQISICLKARRSLDNAGRIDEPVPRAIMASTAALPQTPPTRFSGRPRRSMRCLNRSGGARDVQRLERRRPLPSVASRARLEPPPCPHLLALSQSPLQVPCACPAPLDD